MGSFQVAPSFPFADPDLARPWMDLKLPSLTLATLIEAQNKNAAALGSANQVAFDGLKTLLHRQGVLLTASVETCGRVTSDFLAAQSLEERATKQADVTRDTYFSVVARMRELSDIVMEANMAAIGIVNARIIEAFGDLRALFAPAASTGHSGEAPVPALPAPAAVPDEDAAVEQAILPMEPDPETVTAASTIAPEGDAPQAAAPEAEPIAAPTAPPEPVTPEPETTAAPTPPRKTAAATAKTAAPPARTTVPKAPPPRPPRRPTSRG